jgi:transcriptional regulator with XRE-family HTH domain
MGGPGSGGTPDRRRQHQVTRLRALGLTLEDIGRRLGLSRQLVHHHLKAAGMAVPRRGTVRCCQCGALIATGHHTIEYNRRPLCLACLEEHPDVPFGRRVKACRLAAGLTAGQLAALSGVPAHAIRAVERGGCWPRWERLARLIRGLGPELVTLGLVEEGDDNPGRATP